MPSIGVMLPNTDTISANELVEMTRLAEANGYDSVWTGEAWGRDAITTATNLAAKTSRIKIGTAIVTVFSRTPGIIAQSAASIDEISGGRFMLGLGTSGAAVIEYWHGLKYQQPLQRTREYVEIIRMALRGDKVNYNGQIFQLRNFRLGCRPVQKSLPIYIASLGPRNVQLTGEVADGWLPLFFSPQNADVVMSDLKAGAQRAGRDASDVAVAALIPTLVNDDVQQANSLLRGHIAFYAAGMGTYYSNLMTRYGFGEEVAAIKGAWANGDRKAAASAVSDRMLDSVAISGTPAQAKQKLETFRAAGVTQPVILTPNGASFGMIQETIAALA